MHIFWRVWIINGWRFLLRAFFASIETQFSSFTQSCPTLCNPMNHSTPGLPVHHQFPEFTQIHVHWVGDAIQLSHPLLSPSPPNTVAYIHLKWYNQNVHNILLSENNFQIISNMQIYQFSHSAMSDSLQSHGLQRTRLPCPSPTPATSAIA